MHHLSRRKLLAASAGTALAGLLSSCAKQSGEPPAHEEGSVRGDTSAHGASSGNNETLTIGFVPIACAAPLLLAHAKGLFAQAGLSVRLRKFAGWADLWTSYATGELDVAHMLSPMPIACDSGITNAARPTELLFTQNTNGQALTLASKHIDRVRTPADLAGLVLGIPFEFSVHALLLRDYLAAHGLDATRDVELRLLRPPDMIAQLTVGTIDGFIGPEPFNQRALRTGAGRIFLPTKQMWDGHPCCSVAAAKTLDPGMQQRLVQALHGGAAIANDAAQMPEAATILAREQYLNQQQPLILQALSGHYTDWAGQPHEDAEMIHFGGQTSSTAITWMAAQLARWQLGSQQPLPLEDAPIIAAANAVLPADANTDDSPITVNGRTFDPLTPAAGY